jgi:hypothetical protein
VAVRRYLDRDRVKPEIERDREKMKQEKRKSERGRNKRVRREGRGRAMTGRRECRYTEREMAVHRKRQKRQSEVSSGGAEKQGDESEPLKR